jgi:hypothetical protein
MVDTMKPGTRLIRKTPAVWQCGSCSSKHVMLSRIFGTFPLPDFVALTDAEQSAFWKEAPTDMQGLKKAITETLTSSMMERTESGTSGKYLPLEVYAKKGFDTVAIEHGCNMKMHPVIGKTYRLDIDNVAWTKIREKCRRQVLEMIDRKSNKPLPDIPDPKPANIEDTGDTSESSDGDKKHDKKHSKKDKKHGKKHSKGKTHKHDKHKKDGKNKKHNRHSKKAKKGGSGKKRKSSSSSSASTESSSSDGNAKKRQVEAQKEEQTLQKKVQADATRVLAKVRPIINNVAELKREEHFGDMPKTIAKKMEAELENLINFEKDAREKIGGTATSLNFNMDDVAKASKAIIESISTVKTMLKQTAKLF